MTVRINKQKINLREKLAGAEDKVNFDEVVRGLGEYTGNVGIGTTNPREQLHLGSDVLSDKTVIRLQNLGGHSLLGIARLNDQLIAGSTNADLVISNNESKNIILGTNKTERLRITSDGKVGIGTTDPANILHIHGDSLDENGDVALRIQNPNGGTTTTSSIRFTNTTSTFDHAAIVATREGSHPNLGSLQFYTNENYNSGTPAMTIDSVSNVGIGTTNPVSGFTAYKLFVNGKMYVESTVKLVDLSASADVQTNAAKELTTDSDKRLKNDLGDCEYGLNEVLQVQPKKYTWKEGPEDQQPTIGFFAQDVHPIMPEAAPREAIQNEKGEDDYNWGFHSQTIIAALVNATKEQQTIINDLKSRIETLEQQ